eukprot:s637_g30.t1
MSEGPCGLDSKPDESDEHFARQNWWLTLVLEQEESLSLAQGSDLEIDTDKLMGCSSSKPAEMPPFKPQPRCDSAHGFNLVASREFDPDKLEDPVSSWNVRSVPEGYPRDKLLPPDRQLHEKHLKKLNRFLKKLEDAPVKLGESRLKQEILCSLYR